MAKTTVVLMNDDLDGREADESLSFPDTAGFASVVLSSAELARGLDSPAGR